MKHAGFQFNDGDADIVHFVYQLRVATIDHLAALTNRSEKTLARRVPKLREEHYLRRLKPQPHKGLYVIGTAGVAALVESGYAPTKLAERRLRENEWKDLTLRHLLFVASIHTKVLLLTRNNPIKLVHWEHDHPKLWDSVETAHGRLPVRPDAYVVLQSGNAEATKRFALFLEADVGTMSHERIVQKIAAYAAYHERRHHIAKFGIPSFKVPIVTRTRMRAKNLAAELHSPMSAAQRRAYPIMALEDITLADLTG